MLCKFSFKRLIKAFFMALLDVVKGAVILGAIVFIGYLLIFIAILLLGNLPPFVIACVVMFMFMFMFGFVWYFHYDNLDMDDWCKNNE